MINNNKNEKTNTVNEQKQYNLDTYTLLSRIQLFEQENSYLKVTLKDKFPYQVELSSIKEDIENKMIVIYDKKEIFEQEIVPEIITRYSYNTTIKNSYYEEQNYTAIMENDVVLELINFEEKVINKLVGYIEKIQNDLQFTDPFEYKLKVEEEKEHLMVLATPTGTSNVLLITLILVALIAIAIIVIILLKIA